MTVERQDSRLTTALKTKNPLRAFGERTFSPFEKPYSKITFWIPLTSLGAAWTVSPVDKDTVIYLRASGLLAEGNREVTRIKHDYYYDEQINEPSLPWYGKIRWRESKNNENTPE